VQVGYSHESFVHDCRLFLRRCRSTINEMRKRLGRKGRKAGREARSERKRVREVLSRSAEDAIREIGKLAAGGRFSAAAALVAELALQGDAESAARGARAIGTGVESAPARMEAAWRLLHRRGMSASLRLLLPEGEALPEPADEEMRIIDASDGAVFGLLAEGLRPSAIMANAKDSLAADLAAARSLGIGDAASLERLGSFRREKRPPLRSKFMRCMDDFEFGFQTTGFALGGIFGRSLWTGEPIVSKHSFVVQLDQDKQAYIFVKFEDVEPWYLMIGSWRGTKSYAYLPGREVVILLQSEAHEWGRLQDFVRAFKAAALKRASACNDYLDRETMPAVYSAGTNNLGHFFWNDFQGIVDAQARGLLDGVRDVVLYKYQFVDILAFLPELAATSVAKPRREEDAFLEPIERGLFCVRPTAVVMNARMADRVRETALRLVSVGQKALISSTAAAGIRIWFNLRAHNKVWLNQVEGVCAVCEALSRRYGNVAVFLDGTPDCAALVRQVKAHLLDSATVIDGTSISLVDSIAWAFSVDAYVATIGSGLTLTTWLAGKPGVAHSETAHLDQLEFWGDVRPDVPAPLGPPRSEIHDVGKGMYCDYEIDPRIIASLLDRTLSGSVR
jgi:hypothetical protein